MDRWLFSFITAWMLSLWWPQLPPLAVLPLLVIFAFTCFMRVRKWHTAGAAIIASLWVASVGHWQHHWQLSLFEQGSEHWLEGTISSLVSKQSAARFTLSVTRIDEERQWWSKRIQLTWYDNPPQLEMGQRWRLKARLKPLRGPANEGGRSARHSALARGIGARGYVTTSESARLLTRAVSWRALLSQRLEVLGLSQHRFLAALSLGDRRFFHAQDWALLQRTGTAHLMAISGMHLAVTSALLFGVLNLVLPRVVALYRVHQGTNLRSFVMACTAGCTLLYAWLSGFALPVVRAWLGLVLVMSVVHQRVFLLPRQIFLWVVAIVLVCMPYAPHSASFWLSFCAVAVLLFCLWCFSPPVSHNAFSALRTLLTTQWRLFLLLWPVTGIWFGMVSLSGIAANVIAIPVVTLLLVPLCLLALPFLAMEWEMAAWLLMSANWIMAWLFKTLLWVDSVSTGALALPHIPLHAWGLLALAMGIACLPRLPFPQVLILCWLLPLGSYFLPSVVPRFRLDVLDVGQGSAAVLSRGQRAMVFDVGASWDLGSMAKRVLIPFLQKRGLIQIDTVILSHLDNDHAGGLPDLLNRIPVRSVLSPDTGCHAPLHWQWLGLNVEVLWPPPGRKLDANNGSCVVRVSGEHFAVLFSGDIEMLAEIQLLEQYTGQALQADILIAPHHGSATSSSSAFVHTVGAQHVVFSHGFMHRWNFPVQAVVARYIEAGATLYSTAESGQISFLLPDEARTAIEVRRFRDH